MKTILFAVLAVIISSAFIACASPTSTSPATVNLTADKIQLSVADTVGGSDASLSCGCPCKLQNMMVTGDTNVIHFDLAALQDEQSTHHITAMASPSMTKPGSYSCTFSFVMHDPMDMGGMNDYSASVTAVFIR